MDDEIDVVRSTEDFPLGSDTGMPAHVIRTDVDGVLRVIVPPDATDEHIEWVKATVPTLLAWCDHQVPPPQAT